MNGMAIDLRDRQIYAQVWAKGYGQCLCWVHFCSLLWTAARARAMRHLRTPGSSFSCIACCPGEKLGSEWILDAPALEDSASREAMETEVGGWFNPRLPFGGLSFFFDVLFADLG